MSIAVIHIIKPILGFSIYLSHKEPEGILVYLQVVVDMDQDRNRERVSISHRFWLVDQWVAE